MSASNRGIFNDHTKHRCMACISCAIRDLEKHRAHLNELDESVFVLQQLQLTSQCLVIFYEQLRDFGIDIYQQNECGCTGQGSNRMSSSLDDIAIIRAGQDAMEHFARLGEHLLEEITHRRGMTQDKSLKEISRTFEDLDRRFRVTLDDLQRDENIVSFEIVSRGWRLDFMGMHPAGLRQLGFK